MNANHSSSEALSNWQKGWIAVTPAILLWMVWLQWDSQDGSVSIIHNRLFVLAWAGVGFAMVISLLLKPYWLHLNRSIVAANLIAITFYVGIAVGTTDWANWPMDRWWQGWATVPLFMGVFPFIREISAAGSGSRSDREQVSVAASQSS